MKPLCLAFAFAAVVAAPLGLAAQSSTGTQTPPARPPAPTTYEEFVFNIAADDAKPKTRASVVAEMEAAIDHQAEHYGKLVSNYRMNGIVPPVSRR